MEKPQRPKRKDFSKGALGDMSYNQALQQWQANMDDWRRQQRSSGSTMYDRGARSGHTPSSGSGQHHFRGRRAGRGHFTQSYDDGYRLSRDTDGEGDSRVHWTDQNVGKKNRNRHTPPSDAQ